MHRCGTFGLSRFLQPILDLVTERSASQSAARTHLDMSALESRLLFSATPLGAIASDFAAAPDADATQPEWLIAEDYADGVADLHTPQSGTWTVENERYRVTTNGNAISTFALDSPLDESLEFNVTLNAESGGFINGFVIFDYQSQTDFKFAGAYVGSNQWVVGNYNSQGWNTEAVFRTSISTATDYQVNLNITDGSQVELSVDGQLLISHTFSDVVTDGALGLGSRLATTNFDDVAIRSLVAPEPEPEPESEPRVEPDPSSNIIATQVGRDLLVSGDAAGQLEIVALGKNTVQILDNGQELYSFEDVVGSLRLEFGDGNDQVTLDLGGYRFEPHVTIDLGDGDDTLTVQNGSIGRSLKIQAGDGNDTIDIADVTTERQLRIWGDAGNDQIDIQGNVGRNLNVRAGDGDDSVSVDAEIGRHLRIKGEDGNDTVAISAETSIGNHARLAGGHGDDSIVVGGAITKSLSVHAGSGDDNVIVDASIGGHLRVRGGDGADAITLGSGTTVAGNACIHAGAGNDTVAIEGAIQRSLYVHLGSGDDSATVNATTEHMLKIRGGRGGDSIVIGAENRVGWCALVKGGSGNDAINVQGTVGKALLILDGRGHDAVTVDATINGQNQILSEQEKEEERARCRFFLFT